MPSYTSSQYLQVIQKLLEQQLWKEAALNICATAQIVASKKQSEELKDLWEQLPQIERNKPCYFRTVAWLAYRNCKKEALRQVSYSIDQADQKFFAFKAFLASEDGDWHSCLQYASKTPVNTPEYLIALRYRAIALVELKKPEEEWKQAFHKAIEITKNRDRGLILLDFAHYLTQKDLIQEARDAYAQAVNYLKGDAIFLTFSYANLGIACLKIGDMKAARIAIKKALNKGKKPRNTHLTVAWRAWGYLAFRQGCWEQAQYAFEEAEKTAEFQADQVEAIRGQIWIARVRENWDLALELAHQIKNDCESGIQQQDVDLDLAGIQLKMGTNIDLELDDLEIQDKTQRWRLKVLKAELCHQQGKAFILPEREPDNSAERVEVWTFPELFWSCEHWLELPKPVWRLRVDGPIQLFLNEEEIPLVATNRPAVLLAMLVIEGELSADQAIDGLSIDGENQRAKEKKLNAIVRDLRQIFGWPASVTSAHKLVSLSPEIEWEEVYFPPAERSGDFCKGCYYEWVNEKISESNRLS